MTLPPTLPSDRQLVQAARGGHEAAWAELMSRHEASIRAVLPNRPRAAQRAVTRSLEDLRTNLDDAPSGEVAVRAFRPLAISRVTGGAYGPEIAGEPASDDHVVRDRRLLATAFGRLPEPWQAVLWHSHVEQLSAAEVSPLVGRTVSDVGELIATAERGLTDALLIEYVEQTELSADVAEIVPLLSGHVRDALPAHEERLVAEHLAGDAALSDQGERGDDEVRHTADDSRRLIAIASSLPESLPPAVAPGITGLNVQQHRRAVGTASRAFGAESMAASQSGRLRTATIIGCVAAMVLAVGAVAFFASRSGQVDGDASLSPSTSVDGPSSTAVPDGTDPSTTSTEPTDTSDSPETTVPRPTGPANDIGLTFGAGSGADGSVEPVPSLDTIVSTAAPVFAGGTGTLDLAITNDGDAPVDAFVELALPSGVVLDGLAGGDATCVDPVDDSAYCDVSVAAGDTLDVSVRLALESMVVGRLVVDGETLTEPFEAPIVATQDLIHNSVGRGDVLVVGNTVMTCDRDEALLEGIDCDAVTAGTGSIVNRWDVPMEFTGAAPDFGFFNGSQAVLDLPDTSEIVSAHLFWAGDLEEGDATAGDRSSLTVTMVLPTGEPVALTTPDVTFGEEDATQYLSRLDVTEIVAEGRGGQYLVGNIASVETHGSFGAWALVVVTDDDALPRRHRIVTDPFAWVAPDDEFFYDVALPVPVVTAATAQLDVVAFEGERGFEPESLMVGGVDVGGTNPFDSTIVGERNPTFENNLGVDIDAYDLTIDAPDGSLLIEANSNDDGIRLAVLGLTVDIES